MGEAGILHMVKGTAAYYHSQNNRERVLHCGRRDHCSPMQFTHSSQRQLNPHMPQWHNLQSNIESYTSNLNTYKIFLYSEWMTISENFIISEVSCKKNKCKSVILGYESSNSCLYMHKYFALETGLLARPLVKPRCQETRIFLFLKHALSGPIFLYLYCWTA